MKPTRLIRFGWNDRRRTLCCDSLSMAFSSRTDNSMYGSLAGTPTDDPTNIRFGCELPAIAFCPWCGTPAKDILWDKEEV
jgi:hypothetical protein